MSSNREQESDALKKVLDTAIDGRKGFEQAIEHCGDASSHLKSFMQSSKQECSQAASEIKSLLSTYGVEPDTDGTIAGAMHRGWNAVRAAFTPNEEAAFVSEIVRGEEHAVKTYEEALESVASPHVRSKLESQLQGLRANLTRARAFDRVNN